MKSTRCLLVSIFRELPRLKYSWFIALGFLLFPLSSSASVIFVTDSSDIISVLHGDMPPRHIPEEVYVDILKKLPVSRMVVAPHERIDAVMNGQQAMCTPYRLKTATREKTYLFSLPTDFFFSRRLYQSVKSDPIRHEFLNEAGEVRRLAEVMASLPTSRLLVGANHSYGDFLDKEIAALSPSQIYVRHGLSPYNAMIEMLAKGRVDFYFSFPTIVKSSKVEDYVRSYAIAGMPSYQTGHLMCNDSEESRVFLKRFNDALMELYQTGKFLDFAKVYLPTHDVEKLKNIIDELTYSL